MSWMDRDSPRWPRPKIDIGRPIFSDVKISGMCHRKTRALHAPHENLALGHTPAVPLLILWLAPNSEADGRQR